MAPLGVCAESGNHHCWIFDEPAEFHARARDFLLDGLRNNERVWYVGDAPDDVLLGELDGIRFDDALSRGAARVVPIAEAYPAGGTTPQDQVDRFAAMLADSLAEGFAGLRVAADATSLAGQDSWNRYEHMVDRLMIGRPLSGLCGFDGRRLDPGRAAELECLHPITNTATVPFRVTAYSPSGDRLALSGELDSSTHDLLVRVLDAADLRPQAGRVMIDVGGLAFVDHRSLLELARYAADRGARLMLRDPRQVARRIVELLGDPTIRWEVTP